MYNKNGWTSIPLVFSDVFSRQGEWGWWSHLSLTTHEGHLQYPLHHPRMSTLTGKLQRIHTELESARRERKRDYEYIYILRKYSMLIFQIPGPARSLMRRPPRGYLLSRYDRVRKQGVVLCETAYIIMSEKWLSMEWNTAGPRHWRSGNDDRNSSPVHVIGAIQKLLAYKVTLIPCGTVRVVRHQ